jgi:hypothetical protein
VARKDEVMMMMVMIMIIIIIVIISSNVKVRDIFHRQNNITCSTNYKYVTAAILYTIETLFGSGM